MDVFHAVSRITAEVKQKDLKPRKKRNMFNKELSLVFRSDNDTGPKRNLPTPQPSIIAKRLRKLKENWEDSIPEKATYAIEKLLDHAENGCLR